MKKFIKSCLILACFATVLILYFFCFGTAQVHGSSMYPTYEDGDFLFIVRVKPIKYDDIVAIGSDDLGKLLCKRVIGLEGDHIVINTNGIYRNDILLDEYYLPSDLVWLDSDSCIDITVNTNEIFVLGDNRNASTDSRVLGNLNKSDVFGVSVLNITKSIGLTRQHILYITAFLWIVFGLFCIFSRKRTQTDEG